MNQVFISFCNSDEMKAKHIGKMLERNGVMLWKAPDMVPADVNHDEASQEAIKNCDTFIIILSRYSQKLDAIYEELSYAVSLEKNIVPVALDNNPLDDKFKDFFKDLSIIPYYKSELRGNCLIVENIDKGRYSKDSDSSAISNYSNQLVTITPGMARKMQKEADLKKLQQKEAIIKEREMLMAEKRKRWNDINNTEVFLEIKKLLDAKGPLSVDEIYFETGISKELIKEYIRQERLEIPGNQPAVFICEKCGARIRTGSLCANCKRDTPAYSLAEKNEFFIKKR